MSNKRISIFLVFLLLFNFLSFKSHGQNQSTVINKLLEGIGGEKSLKEAHYIMFSCINEDHTDIQEEHTYIYDRSTKNCRFEGKTKEGDSLTVLFNTQNSLGKLYINNEKKQNPELLKSIIQLFNEDSYLLLTPMQLANNRLNLTIQAPVIIDLKKYFILEVNSANGQNESAKLYIDSQTGIIRKWETFNKDQEKIHEFVTSRIKDIGGGLTLATQFTDKISGTVFKYPIVAALLNIETSKFQNL
ncbi:hypothetical protein [Albibacterium sp.]|uniref:hypothetical protein n=1 Tax=Albibacterium sp. TaxID=2952885 RepID=UPI002C32EC1A|nr:hypothetical protein [Albibacterium sp.]HUH20124.1 hypothetical protein [Albibacterium sp.]